MRRIRSMILATTMICGWSVTASAQLAELIDVNNPDNRYNVFPITWTLTDSAVQQELALTDAQKQDVKRWKDEERAFIRSRPRVFDLNDLSKEERDQRVRETEENLTKVAKGMLAVLDEGQKTRLAQLRLQQLGSRALRQNSFATALNLSNEQLVRIKDLIAANADTMTKHLADRPKDRTESEAERSAWEKKSAAAIEKLNEELFSVLTAEQQTQWDALQGKKFEFRRQSSQTIAASPDTPATEALSPARAALVPEAQRYLNDEAVRKELALTNVQSQDLMMRIDEFNQTSREFSSPEARLLKDEERKARDQQFFAVINTLQMAMIKLLDDRQVERLGQLKLQKDGPRALLRDDIAVQLKLSPEQRTKLQ